MDVPDAGPRQNSSREFWLVPVGQHCLKLFLCLRGKFVTPDARVCETAKSPVGPNGEIILRWSDRGRAWRLWDCFAELVIGRGLAPTRWLAKAGRARPAG